MTGRYYMKTFLMLIISVSMYGNAAAAEPVYSDIRLVFKKWTVLNNQFADEAKKAGDGKQVARAINKYTGEMEKFQVEFEKVENKYPNIFKENEGSAVDADDPKRDIFKEKLLNIKKYLKDDTVDKFIESYETMIRIITDLMEKYEDDEEVIKAFEKIQ
jgi:hypothetical protein